MLRLRTPSTCRFGIPRPHQRPRITQPSTDPAFRAHACGDAASDNLPLAKPPHRGRLCSFPRGSGGAQKRNSPPRLGRAIVLDCGAPMVSDVRIRWCAHGIGCALPGGGAPMVFGASADPCRRYSARRSLAFFSSFLSMATGSLTLARKIMAAMMYGLNEASL